MGVYPDDMFAESPLGFTVSWEAPSRGRVLKEDVYPEQIEESFLRVEPSPLFCYSKGVHDFERI
jgi:hypothetical protein